MTVTLESTGAVAVLTIDRPEKRNAMSFEMWSALPSLLDKVAADEAVRALVIQGTDHFSAGADISGSRHCAPTPRVPGATAPRSTTANEPSPHWRSRPSPR